MLRGEFGAAFNSIPSCKWGARVHHSPAAVLAYGALKLRLCLEQRLSKLNHGYLQIYLSLYSYKLFYNQILRNKNKKMYIYKINL